MSPHLFLRAYMAGIAPPTAFAMLAYVFVTLRHEFFSIPLPPLERFMIFPIIVGPNLWGLWNGLRAVMPRRLPLALHGALLPPISFTLGYAVAQMLGITIPGTMIQSAPVSLAMLVVLYYLVWKFVVGFMNTLVDVD
jgi:hypothetical protein